MVTINKRRVLTAEEMLSKGKKAEKAGDLQRAVDLFYAVLRDAPDHPVARKRIAKLRKLILPIHSGSNPAKDPAAKQLDVIASLMNSGSMMEAEELCQAVLHQRPNSVGANRMLGAMLTLRGENISAAQIYKKALLGMSYDSELLDDYANVSLELGDLSTAVTSLNKANLSDSINPQKAACYAMSLNQRAKILHNYGLPREAMEFYNKSLDENPNLASTHYNRGRLLYSLGAIPQAIDDFGNAVSLDSSNDDYWRGLIAIFPFAKFDQYSDKFEYFFTSLLKHAGTDTRNVCIPMLSAYKSNSVVSKFIARGEDYTHLHTRELMAELSKLSGLRTLMELEVVCDLDLEKLFTCLREAMLINVQTYSAQQEDEFPEIYISMGIQCFLNEYIYPETAQETLQLEILESDMRDSLKNGIACSPIKVAILAAYRPLNRFDWLILYAANCNSSSLAVLLKYHISNLAEETNSRHCMHSLGDVGDKVSLSVRQQYEENCYPRWEKIAIPAESMDLQDMLGATLHTDGGPIFYPQEPDVLIAGCGTGRQAISVATSVRGSNVLALDLSLSSLSYTDRKMKAMGVANIELLHADILNLDELAKSFDVVECSGVLHHMADPLEGWRILSNKLRPNGLMKIGLYSHVAREALGIGDFRRALTSDPVSYKGRELVGLRQQLIDHSYSVRLPEVIFSTPDFYSLSMFRDLLVHAHEVWFTIPKIRDACSTLGLEFLGFSHPTTAEGAQRINAEFQERYPHDGALCDLSSWQQYEADNPLTFMGMYQFWVRKI